MSGYPAFEELEWTGWQERAEGYDDTTLQMTGATIPSLISAAGLHADQRVLDVCCGTGEVARHAGDKGAAVTGLDFSPEMLAVARSKVPGARFIEGDAQALPFDDNAFDIVLSNFGHYHLPDPDQAIVEAARVLRPGGTYAFTTWLGPDASPGFQLILDTVLGNVDPNVTLPAAPDAFRLANRDTVTRVMEAAGFIVVSVSTFPSKITCAPSEFVTFLKAATVRATMILKAQPEKTREKIEAMLLERVQRFVRDGLVVLPVPNRIVIGRRIE